MHYFKLSLSGKILRFFIVFLFMGFSIGAAAQEASRDTEEYKKGESLFKGNCASCHGIHKDVAGAPVLLGVLDRHDREWFYPWIKNSSAVIKSGDPKGVALFEEYNKTVMTAFPMLTDGDIDNILEYIRVETVLPPPPPPGDSTTTPTETAASPMLMIFLGIVTVLLFVLMLIMTKVLRSLNVMVREKNDEPIPEPFSMDGLVRSRGFKIAFGLAVFVFLSYTTFDNASSLGRQQGYQPEQPIKFSHELHAGKYDIDCQYCHSGAAKGKNAVIPSTNVCMNCHKAITSGPKYGKEEIAKVYQYAGWDPAKREYTNEGKSVEWVKIHNLPDHVYFNHSQHVTAGNIECQTCHGEVEKMEVVEQHSSLGMGWCIDCHRTTNVQFSNNEYYNIYEKYHEELKSGDRTKVTVEDIGGTECQKCHY